MLTKKNFVSLEGGLTRDAELGVNNENVIKMSIGVDGAGSEAGTQFASGYFDLTLWMTKNKYTAEATAEQARTLFESGALVKGTRISIIGQLHHDRWTNKDGTKSQRVNVLVETIDCYTKAGAKPAGSVEAAASASASSSIDDF